MGIHSRKSKNELTVEGTCSGPADRKLGGRQLLTDSGSDVKTLAETQRLVGFGLAVENVHVAIAVADAMVLAGMMHRSDDRKFVAAED